MPACVAKGRAKCLRLNRLFTVLRSVARPWNESEAGVDLALIQTSLLFLCESWGVFKTRNGEIGK